MKASEMINNIRYIVTKGTSDEDTLFEGDHVMLLENGDLYCEEAGWLSAEDVKEVIEKIEVQLDQEWLEKQKQKILRLQQELSKL